MQESSALDGKGNENVTKQPVFFFLKEITHFIGNHIKTMLNYMHIQYGYNSLEI